MPGNFGRWTPKEAAYLEWLDNEMRAQEDGHLFDPVPYTTYPSVRLDILNDSVLVNGVHEETRGEQ